MFLSPMSIQINNLVIIKGSQLKHRFDGSSIIDFGESKNEGNNDGFSMF